MNISEKGLQFIAQREGCVLQAYRDGKRLAIGFGDNDPKLFVGKTITLDDAIARFVPQAQKFAAGVSNIFPEITLRQQHIDALTSAAYNYGIRGLQQKAPDLITAVRAYYKDLTDNDLCNTVGLEFTALPANRTRRRREAVLFTTGDYGDLTYLNFWDAGSNPHLVRPEAILMPKFLKGS